MADLITGSVKIDVNLLQTQVISGELSPSRRAIDFVQQFAAGTADAQLDELWSTAKDFSQVVGQTDYDLQALAQTDDAGGAVRSGISLDGVKVIAIENTSAVTSTGYLLIGAGAAAPWDGLTTPFAVATAKIALYPGDAFVWTSRAGGVVTATEKDLRVAAVTATQTYTMVIGGEAT